jgi:hypothetical protein
MDVSSRRVEGENKVIWEVNESFIFEKLLFDLHVPNSRTIVVCMMWPLCHCEQNTRHCHDPWVILVQKVARPDLYTLTALKGVVPHQVEGIPYGVRGSSRLECHLSQLPSRGRFPLREDQHDRALVRYHQTDIAGMRWPRGGDLEVLIFQPRPESRSTKTAFSGSALLVEISSS